MILDVKVHKKINKVELYNWEDVFVELDIDHLERILNSDMKFIRFWDRIIAKANIKEIKPFILDWIASYILTFTKDIQEKLKTREKEKKTLIGRWFDSIEEVDNWLKEKKLVLIDD